jgi:hypothetical protein
MLGTGGGEGRGSGGAARKDVLYYLSNLRSASKQSTVILEHEDQDSLSRRHRSRPRLGRRECAVGSANSRFVRSAKKTSQAIQAILIVHRDWDVGVGMLKAAAGERTSEATCTGARRRLRFCPAAPAVQTESSKPRSSAVPVASQFVAQSLQVKSPVSTSPQTHEQEKFNKAHP